MKYWLSGLALMMAATTVQAENYRIVQSPSQKLDVWIDDIQGTTAQSWCAQDLDLRIVANGNKDVAILDNFMPRLGSLLENQCGKLRQVNWTLTDPQNKTLAHGSAAKAKDWAVSVSETPATPATPAAPPVSAGWTLPDEHPETLSPAADRTPWQEFMLQDGCRLRTYWQGGAQAPALFIPASDASRCEKGNWLSGHSVVTQQSQGADNAITLSFVHGFPVAGLSDKGDFNKLLITTVNNERMIIRTENADQSWLILPYSSATNSWKNTGTIALEVTREQASDQTRLRERLDAVSRAWTPWFAPDVRPNIVLIDALRPQLRNPAVGAWRAAH
ncbi:hypothetical protein [Superficieibacter sp.]|uniref:hypothetical protein n=1 Tax=Superficieibacter sp. TaxID=2303322 RepID=UPI0028AA8569|nr:hypothetical protein [Superficieibacter sp.]